MKKLLVVAAGVAIVGLTSCKKETINQEDTSKLPVLNANIGEKITFQVVAVEKSGNRLQSPEVFVTVK